MAAGHGVIYVSNLPYEAHEAVVQQAFEDEQIAVSSVQLLKKGSFNRCRNSGLACVTITCSGDVQHCCNLMDGKQIYGRPMIVRKDKFEADDPAYDSTTAVAAVPAAAAAAALQAPAAGSAVAAVQHVKGAAAKAKQLAVVPSQCAAAAAATAAGGGSPNSSRWTANSVRFVG